jgi:type IV pilus assembly protein PilC
MALLQKKFFDKNGNFDNNQIIALLKKAQKAQLKSEFWGGKQAGKEFLLFAKAGQKDVWQFINKFSIFINSGIDVKGALGILIKQSRNPLIKKIVEEMRNNIDHGIAIHETMLQHPKVFDSLTTALIEVGEKTGQLWKILQELDTNLLESIELKGKVKGAMVYPMILLILTLCMVVFMMVFIVPRITEAFTKAGAELPGLTQFIVNVSDFFINGWPKIIIGFVIFFITVKLAKLTYTGQLFFAKLAFKAPIFWFVVRQSNIIYFIKSFTILLDAGVLLLESIKTASKVVPNLLYKREIIRIKNEVEVGLTMSKSLGLNLDYETNVYLNKLFSEEFAYVVSTGEETGTLSNSLKKIGINYNNELKRYIGNMSSMMEPIVIVIVGALVGTIIIGIMMPFFQMGEVAKNL